MTDPDRTLEPDRLRHLFEDAVADVQPAPALDRIRDRTTVTPIRRTRPWFLVTAGAGAGTRGPRSEGPCRCSGVRVGGAAAPPATTAAVALATRPAPRADPPPGPPATTTATPTDPPPPDPASDEPSQAASPSPSASP